MERCEPRLDELGRLLADAQDAEVRPEVDLALARARLAERERAGRVRRPRLRLRLAWIGGGLALAAAAGGFALFMATRPLTFAVDGVGVAALGAPLEARTAALPIRFSEGTAVVLAPRARARITRVDRRGADIALAAGRAEVSVVPGRGGRWLIDAGPFRVRVTGTRFSVAWDASQARFSLEMRAGSVVVDGGCLPGARTLGAGQSLDLACVRPGSAAERPARAAAKDEPALRRVSAFEPARPTRTEPAAPGQARRRVALVAPPPENAVGWQRLFAEGRYREALAAAEREGFDRLCANARPDELLRLGDAARLSGSAARAEQAYLSLRRRFRGDPAAGAAAFALGRVAADQRRSFAEAARWFELYLRQAPEGALAEEAAGRLLDAWHRSGDAEAARRQARLYLARHPDGSYAALARSLAKE